jgi:hypothetical protein
MLEFTLNAYRAIDPSATVATDLNALGNRGRQEATTCPPAFFIRAASLVHLLLAGCAHSQTSGQRLLLAETPSNGKRPP